MRRGLVREPQRPDRALVFDLDGTLVDSGDIKVRAYEAALGHVTNATSSALQEAYQRHGTMNRDPQLRAAYRDVTGSDPDDGTVRIMLEAYSDVVDRERDKMSPFPGIVGLLARHSSTATLVIASNAPQEEVIASCAAMGFDRYLDAIYGFPTSKEDAIRAVMAEWDLAPDRVTYVGDRREDSEVAARAGVSFCRFGPNEHDEDATINRTVVQLERALDASPRS